MNFMLYPALTVMVFLRRDLGYRIVNPAWLLIVALIEFVVSLILRGHNGAPNALFLFAVASLAAGLAQRFRRWRDVNRGIKQHSFYVGTSCFEHRLLPEFLRRNRRIARSIDPALCMFTGLYCWQFFPALGFWLFMSGLCLAGVEGEVHRRQRNQTLDMVDGIITSETQSEVVAELEEPPAPEQQEPARPVPAGFGDDIQDHIKRRRAKPTPQKGV